MLALVSVLLAAHPSLFFGASDVPALRQAAQTTHASIAGHITAILDLHLSDPVPTPTEYDDFRFLGNQVAVWAFGYQLTGNAAYAAIARTQLLTYAGWAAWDNGETAAQGGPDLNQAHMLLGASLAYDWIWETLSPADRSTIAAKLGLEAQKVADYLPSAWWIDQFLQNHNWIDTAGLGMAALVLSGEDARAAGWLAPVQANLQRLQLSVGAIPDGSWHEGLPYEGYGLSMALPFWVAMRRAGADYTGMSLLRGYGRFFLTAGIPDAAMQIILPFGDFTKWPKQAVLEILRFTAARFRDGYAETAAQRYLAAIGQRGNFLPELWYDVFEFLNYDPAVAAADQHALPLDAAFPDIGAAVLHSSWDPGDFALGFKAGVFGGNLNFTRVMNGGTPCGAMAAWGSTGCGWIDWGHDHNDDMSFWLFGKGTWLAPEAMGYDAGKTANYAYPASQTAYHNALLVDGNGQLGDVRASDSNWNNPWFWQRQSHPLIAPAGTADYAIAGGTGPQLFDASLQITRWDRVLVLARGRYALVRDDVESAVPHAYDWICHFQDGVSVDGTGWMQGAGKNGQSLGVRVISPAQWTVQMGSQTAQLMTNFDPDGQTSYGFVRPLTAAAAQQFLVALVPVASNAWSQKTPVSALAASDPGAGLVVGPGSALEERWIFARAGSPGKTAGDLALSGALAGVAARDASGAPVRAALFGAGELSDSSGGRLLLATSSASAIEVSVQGATLSVTGSGIDDFQAYAPSASSVVLNGRAAAAKFESGMVTYPAPVVPCCAPPADAGTPDAGAPDAGQPDSGPPDSGLPDAGASIPDGGASTGRGTSSDAGPAMSVAPLGCSSSGSSPAWPMLAGALALAFRPRRRECGARDRGRAH